MDRAAKDWIDHLAQVPFSHTPDIIQFEGWSCTINGVKMTLDPTNAVLCKIHSGPMSAYLSDPKCSHMDSMAFDLVDWSAVCSSLSGFAPLFWMWASKHVS
jgi:hypothetical protein